MCLFFHISVPLCKAVHDIAYNLEINKVICITKLNTALSVIVKHYKRFYTTHVFH